MFKNLEGKRFGRLTALKIVGKSKSRSNIWRCKCDCGDYTDVIVNSLTRGSTKSCGCLSRDINSQKTFKDISGMKFGRLTVIDFAFTKGEFRKTQRYWNCICDCGNKVVKTTCQISKGYIQSCGCLQVDYANGNKNNYKHGKRKTRLYTIWINMNSRCSNKNNPNYKNYGGRGISVCDEWKSDFLSFYNWANENGYSKDLSIDRIDNNGVYDPNNCRWATYKTQANNSRQCKFVTIDGETKNIVGWLEYYGIPKHVYYSKKYGIKSPKLKILKILEERGVEDGIN